MSKSRTPRRAAWASSVVTLGLLAFGVSAHGEQLAFSRSFGGAGTTTVDAVAVDRDGNIYVGGSTVADGLATDGAPQKTRSGDADAFVAKLSPDGAVLWLTYLGGSDADSLNGLAIDSSGAVYVCGLTWSRNFPTANAFQTALQPSTGGGAFVAKLAADGSRFVYSTYLGGSRFDYANAIAVDAEGAAYVTGAAVSPDFPTVHPIQPIGSPDFSDAFVTKFAPDGQSLVYSTFLGGPSWDYGLSIAVNACDEAHIAGVTNSADGNQDAFVAKLDASGSRLIYSRHLGGTAYDAGLAIAIETSGGVYVAGQTRSLDFPSKSPLQPRLAAVLAARSADGGRTWSTLNDTFRSIAPLSIVEDPRNPATLYAVTPDSGVLKSIDAGASWTEANRGLPNKSALAIAVAPSTLYVTVAGSGVYTSADGGDHWSERSSGLPASATLSILRIDPQDASVLYAGGEGVGLFRSSDAGATWNRLNVDNRVNSLLIDPRDHTRLYIGITSFFHSPGLIVPGGLMTSADSGQTFTGIDQDESQRVEWLTEMDTSGVIYSDLGGIVRSRDGGHSWTPLGFQSLRIDRTDSAVIYASGVDGLYRSRDRGDTWEHIDATIRPLQNARVLLADGATLFAAGGAPNADSFVTRLDAAGEILSSTYFGGTGTEAARGIALGPDGTVVITGSTSSPDLPLAGALQSAASGMFITRLSADGGVAEFSTYLGGSDFENGRAGAVDAAGAIVVTSSAGAVVKVNR